MSGFSPTVPSALHLLFLLLLLELVLHDPIMAPALSPPAANNNFSLVFAGLDLLALLLVHLP